VGATWSLDATHVLQPPAEARVVCLITRRKWRRLKQKILFQSSSRFKILIMVHNVILSEEEV
jgi:hypothetical protein